MRGWILYVLASLFALSASLAWRLGDPSPWASLGARVEGVVLRSHTVAGADGAVVPEVVVAFEVDGIRREATVEGLVLHGDANCSTTPAGEIAGWRAGHACTLLLPFGPLGAVRSARVSKPAFAAAIAFTVLAAAAVVAGLLWSLRHDLRGAPTERPVGPTD